jgi:hypothetical protein
MAAELRGQVSNAIAKSVVVRSLSTSEKRDSSHRGAENALFARISRGLGRTSSNYGGTAAAWGRRRINYGAAMLFV